MASTVWNTREESNQKLLKFHKEIKNNLIRKTHLKLQKRISPFTWILMTNLKTQIKHSGSNKSGHPRANSSPSQMEFNKSKENPNENLPQNSRETPLGGAKRNTMKLPSSSNKGRAIMLTLGDLHRKFIPQYVAFWIHLPLRPHHTKPGWPNGSDLELSVLGLYTKFSKDIMRMKDELNQISFWA